MRNQAMPFGLLFQEPAVDPGEMPVPSYDEDRDISLIEKDGEAIPFVTVVPSGMATQTITEVERESTDQDFDPANPDWCLGTFTETKIEREPTDRDPSVSLVAMMATQTATAVAREDTDED